MKAEVLSIRATAVTICSFISHNKEIYGIIQQELGIINI